MIYVISLGFTKIPSFIPLSSGPEYNLLSVVTRGLSVQKVSSQDLDNIVGSKSRLISDTKLNKNLEFYIVSVIILVLLFTWQSK